MKMRRWMVVVIEGDETVSPIASPTKTIDLKV
jgi:hypothetical protein